MAASDTKPKMAGAGEKTADPATADKPEGQSLPAGDEPVIGTEKGDYAEPVTGLGPGRPGQTQPTNTVAEDDDKPDLKKSKVVGNFKKITGYDDDDILAINEQTKVIVTSDGAKNQLNDKGNQVRHLSGPAVPKSEAGKDLGDRYVNASASSPFTGTAALLNSSTLEAPNGGARGEMRAGLAQDAEAAEAEAELARERAENAAAAAE